MPKSQNLVKTESNLASKLLGSMGLKASFTEHKYMHITTVTGSAHLKIFSNKLENHLKKSRKAIPKFV